MWPADAVTTTLLRLPSASMAAAMWPIDSSEWLARGATSGSNDRDILQQVLIQMLSQFSEIMCGSTWQRALLPWTMSNTTGNCNLSHT